MGAIKENMNTAEEAEAVSEFHKLKDEVCDGILPEKDSSNYDARQLGIIEAKAFDYAMYGSEDNGKTAISAIQNYIETCTYEGASDNYRLTGHMIFTAAEVYDWCYPLLTQEDQEAIVAGCQKIARDMEIGFPPGGQGAVVGHGSEAQLLRDWLALGIAVYDEYPDVYHYVAGRLFSEYVPARNYWYTSGTQHQGSAYGPYRYTWDMWAQWLIYRMSGEKMYLPESAEVMYQWIYTRRADGQILRDGDDYNETYSGKGYWNVLAVPLFYAANFYKDPVLKQEFNREYQGGFTYNNASLTPVQMMVFNDPGIGTESLKTLPLTKYSGSPAGNMVARTGWNRGIGSPDVLVSMNMGEVWGANHDHVDSGNFQIYYKGILASESGFYETYNSDHDLNYNKESVAHNVMLIEGSEGRDGGQRRPNNNLEPADMEAWTGTDEYVMAEVTGREFGPNIHRPAYSYLADDLTRSYGGDVEEALRSMLFMPLDNEDHPAAFVVFDKVTTKNAGAEKTFLLHMQQEPAVEGNVSVIKNNVDGYNGMLTNQTLLPADADIVKLGGPGQEFMAGDINYALKTLPGKESSVEAGWGRIEISPKTPEATEYFLNVMYVNDADQELETEEAVLIENEQVAGAMVFDRAAVFNKASGRIREKVTFEIPGEKDVLKINVAGLREGTWKITADGADLGTQVASAEGGIIYFTGAAGRYELTYVSEDSRKEFEEGVPPIDESPDLILDGNYLFTDAAAAVIDGVVYVPASAVYQGMKAQVDWNEETQTATAENNKVSVRLTAGQTAAYINHDQVELDSPVIMKDGSLMIPISFITEKIGMTAAWDAANRCILLTTKVSGDTEGIPNRITVRGSEQSGDDGLGAVIANSYDGDFTTRWAPQGKDGAAWGVYDLGDVYSLDKTYIAYHNGDKRVYYFGIAVSEDGEAYTTIIENGQSSGTTLEYEAYDLGGAKARYVKYIGGGNSVNDWNSVTEIAFSGIINQEPNPDPDPDPGPNPSPDPDSNPGPNSDPASDSNPDAAQTPEENVNTIKSPDTSDRSGEGIVPEAILGAGHGGAEAAVSFLILAVMVSLAVCEVLKKGRKWK